MIHKIYDMVGELATTEEPGQKLYEIIHPCLLRSEAVELDFTGVKVFASPFMNFAFGQLLKDISPEKVNQLMEFIALNDDGWDVLEYVMTKAKRYYSDEKYRTAVDAAINRFSTQAVDGYDLLLLETISKAGQFQVVTDDIDYSVVPDIQVFTSNNRLIQEAATQNKLVVR